MVARAFEQAIQDIRTQIGESAWEDTISRRVAPQAFETIKELPTIALSLRSVELEAKLKFVKGCLALLGGNGRASCSALASHDVFVQLQKALAGKLRTLHVQALMVSELFHFVCPSIV